MYYILQEIEVSLVLYYIIKYIDISLFRRIIDPLIIYFLSIK
jgi:hypothetical protein